MDLRKTVFAKFSLLLFASFAFLGGCATQIVEIPAPMQTPTKKLSSFDSVIYVDAEMKEPYAGQGANEKAAKKINSETYKGLVNIFGSDKVSRVADISETSGSSNTLIIKPVIKQIKFVNATARVFAGAMAGSSVVVMDVHYIDQANGEQIGSAGIERVASAYSGAFGIADNLMLNDVAKDVVTFTRSNY